MSKRDDFVRLHHMLDAALGAVEFVAVKSREDLDTDRILTLALVKSIEIIGEAASKISREFRNSRPEIPWADIIGMRHRLIHAYDNVNPDILWEAVTGDLPPLIDALRKIMDFKS